MSNQNCVIMSFNCSHALMPILEAFVSVEVQNLCYLLSYSQCHGAVHFGSIS